MRNLLPWQLRPDNTNHFPSKCRETVTFVAVFRLSVCGMPDTPKKVHDALFDVF